MKKLFVLFVVCLFVSMLSVTSYAQLIPNGDGTVTDTDTNLMWLQDSNYAYTSGYDTGGEASPEGQIFHLDNALSKD